MQHSISNPSQIQKVPNKLTLLDVQTSQPTHFDEIKGCIDILYKKQN